MNTLRAGLLGLGLMIVTPQVANASCDALKRVALPDVTILSADAVPAGDYRAPATYGPPPAPVALPAYCRVRAVVIPVAGSRIGFELWLPAQGWNGRFKMFGNGGYSSALPFSQLAASLQAGYAVTATDTGHLGDDPDFAVGLPQSIIDWGHRAVHLTAVNAKALTTTFYGRPADHTYFEGCSTGGHQALMTAQRYPEDFDGIIAGAPGHNRTRLNMGFLWQFVSNRQPGSLEPVLTRTELSLLTKAALNQCGGDAERTRGYLNDPFMCRVEVKRLLCKAGESTECLSPEQVRAAERMYQGARNPRTGDQIYPPWLPGSEPGWAAYWADPSDPQKPARASFFKFWAFGDTNWDWRSFDFDRDVDRINDRLADTINATNPDLSAFAARGGKLILYHGLADPVVSPWDTRGYFEAVHQRSGEASQDFARLYFLPGMGHCGGGPGPNLVLAQDVLEQWTEHGSPPAGLPVRRPANDAPTSLAPAWMPVTSEFSTR